MIRTKPVSSCVKPVSPMDLMAERLPSGRRMGRWLKQWPLTWGGSASAPKYAQWSALRLIRRAGSDR